MKQQIFVLRMTGVQDQLIIAQSEEELAFRLYGNKIEHPTAQMFIDTSACIACVGVYDLSGVGVHNILDSSFTEFKSVQSYLDLASENMAKRKIEVLPNE